MADAKQPGNVPQLMRTDPKELIIRGKGEAPVLFANHANISSSPDETVIEFGLKLPDTQNVVDAVVTVVMTVTHAKQLLIALSGQIAQYEQNFGTVETDLLKRLSPSILKQMGLQPEE